MEALRLKGILGRRAGLPEANGSNCGRPVPHCLVTKLSKRATTCYLSWWRPRRPMTPKLKHLTGGRRRHLRHTSSATRSMSFYLSLSRAGTPQKGGPLKLRNSVLPDILCNACKFLLLSSNSAHFTTGRTRASCELSVSISLSQSSALSGEIDPGTCELELPDSNESRSCVTAVTAV